MTAPAGARGVVCDEMRTVDSDGDILESWKSLCAADAASTPFQRPEWLLPWWHTFAAPDGSPRLLVMRDRASREIVGLSAVWVRRESTGLRRVAFVGTGNTDYVDVIAKPGAEPSVAAALIAYLCDIRSEWDACDLHPLPPTSPLMSTVAPQAWQVILGESGVYPRLLLERGERAIDVSVPHRLLRRLRAARRRLAQRGRLEIVNADAANAASVFAEFCALHEHRWSERGEAGVLADERVQRFHEEVVPAMARAGILRLNLIRLDDRSVSAFYGFAQHGCLYCYLGAFDPAFARESAGSLAILAALERAVDQGDWVLDFLNGAEAYKYRWGAVDRVGHRLSLSPTTPTVETPA